jgi:hypothetical protein
VGIGASSAREFAQVRAGASDVDEGVCVDTDWDNGLVTVDIGGASRVMAWKGSAPWVGDTVIVDTLGRKPRAIVKHGAPVGTVTSVDSSVASVLADDGRTYTYPFRTGDALTPGDRVALDHSLHLVAAEYSSEPEGGEYTTPGGPPSSGGRAAWFYPTDSGHYRFGVYKNQNVEVSSERAGYYWYGTQIANTIPAGSTVSRMELNLVENWDNFPATLSQLKVHTDSSSVHGSEPSLIGAAINVTGGGAINVLPFASALQSGGGYGVGFVIGTGWRQFGTGAVSGAIYVEWV